MAGPQWENASATPDLLEFYRRHIGIEYPCTGWVTEATADAIRHFALGVGDDSPLYLDPAYARASPYGGIIAPPTFPDAFANLGFQAQDGFCRGPIQGLFGLWAGDQWEFAEPVRLGDRLTAMFRLVSLRPRPSRFGYTAWEQVEEFRFRNERGQHVATYLNIRFNYERERARSQGKYDSMQPYRYTDEEQAAIARAYEDEPKRRRGAQPRYWDEVRMGEALPPLVKGPLTLTQLIGFVLGWGSAYCGANRLAHQFAKERPHAVLINRAMNVPDNVEGAHWDVTLAQQSGFPFAYDFGCMRTAWMAHLLTDWLGDHGRILRLETQIRRPNILGDTQWMHGRVKALRQEQGRGVAELDLWAASQRGETTAAGEATVALPLRTA